MSTFRHPFLSQGIVRLASGAFAVSRGLVELPDELGESLGWRRVEAGDFVPRSPESRGTHSSAVLTTPNHQ